MTRIRTSLLTLQRMAERDYPDLCILNNCWDPRSHESLLCGKHTLLFVTETSEFPSAPYVWDWAVRYDNDETG